MGYQHNENIFFTKNKQPKQNKVIKKKKKKDT